MKKLCPEKERGRVRKWGENLPGKEETDGRVLVCEGDFTQRNYHVGCLRARGCQAVGVASLEEARRELQDNKFIVLLLSAGEGDAREELEFLGEMRGEMLWLKGCIYFPESNEGAFWNCVEAGADVAILSSDNEGVVLEMVNQYLKQWRVQMSQRYREMFRGARR